MHESVRNRIRKQQQAVLLAASDMQQAAVAARALLEVEGNDALARVFETALAVCFNRPFGGEVRISERYLYSDPPLDHEVQVVQELKTLRDKVYAHTDKKSPREVVIQVELNGDFVKMSWREGWIPLDRDPLAYFAGYCDAIQERLQRLGAGAQLVLDGTFPVEQWDAVWIEPEIRRDDGRTAPS